MIPIAIKNDLTLTMFRPEVVKTADAEARKQGKIVGAHIKIGLNRTGVFPGKTLAEQLEKFLHAVDPVHKVGWPDVKRHICNSGAIGWYRKAYLDAVRMGQRLYMDSRELPLSKKNGEVLREAAS